MVLERNELQIKRIEESILRIGAKVADAVELSQRVKHLSADSDALLINAQQELEKLYVILGNTSTDDKQESEK